MLTIDALDDLGIKTAPDTTPTPAAGPVLPELVNDSPAAKALARLIAGDRVVVVDAPPGSGKTHTICTVVAHLAARTSLRVRVACPTNAQRLSLHDRLDATLPGVCTTRDRVHGDLHPNHVTISTLASLSRSAHGPFDILVVDEAYQATFADVSSAAGMAEQVLLVGDPGQIGPVVSVDTTAWDRMKQPPHRRAPEVFRNHPEASIVNLDRTYRLGPLTAAAIAPIYPMQFTSARPDRVLVNSDGEPLPEIETIAVENPASVDDPSVLTLLAERAATLSRQRLISQGERRTPSVAVVVSRNSQSTFLNALLRSWGAEHIRVGTADLLQGGEWDAVVALDPYTGIEDASDYAASLGRLCVMASRHTTHLTWVYPKTFESLSLPGKDAHTGLSVRRALIGASGR